MHWGRSGAWMPVPVLQDGHRSRAPGTEDCRGETVAVLLWTVPSGEQERHAQSLNSPVACRL